MTSRAVNGLASRPAASRVASRAAATRATESVRLEDPPGGLRDANGQEYVPV